MQALTWATTLGPKKKLHHFRANWQRKATKQMKAIKIFEPKQQIKSHIIYFVHSAHSTYKCCIIYVNRKLIKCTQKIRFLEYSWPFLCNDVCSSTMYLNKPLIQIIKLLVFISVFVISIQVILYYTRLTSKKDKSRRRVVKYSNPRTEQWKQVLSICHFLLSNDTSQLLTRSSKHVSFCTICSNYLVQHL